MFTTEFQTESPTSTKQHTDSADDCLLRREGDRTVIATAEDQATCGECDRHQTQFADLALAMHMRARLNRYEQSMLDELGGQDTITFLIAGEDYLHPADTPLFPLELVETTRKMGGEAIFTQRYYPESQQSDHVYLLNSALVGTLGDEPMVFGFLSPTGNGDQRDLEDSFCTVACAFRRAMKAASDASEPLQERLETDSPVMVVSRATGRILAANRPLARMVDSDPEEVSELSVERVRELLARYVGRVKMSMDTVSVGGQDVSVVTFARTTGSSTGEQKVTGFFAHKMRNKLAGITTAASQWLSMKGATIDETSLELADIVLSEAASLNWQLDRLMSYLQSQDQPRRSVSVSEELMLAVQQIRGIATDRQPPIEWDNEAELGRVSAPSMACCSLFEAVLLRHLAADRAPVQIRFEQPEGARQVKMIFESTCKPSAYSVDELEIHTSYARRLAESIGVELRAPRTDSDGTLTTELTLKTNTVN
ncbi:hypothetical protein GF356_04660 [candidate division GN15 bacterium]|nr:hypothetical protein [candidate division GN15 bacterium]